MALFVGPAAFDDLPWEMVRTLFSQKHDNILNIMPSQVQRLRQKENEEEESKSSLI